MRTRIQEFDKGPGGRPSDKGLDKGSWRACRGFTLIELLAVITIIVIIAAVAAPALNAFKPNVSAAAEGQLLGALARARQLAISQRTTVYMVICPTNFWTDPAFLGPFSTLSPNPPPGVQSEVNKAYRLLNKQMIGYAFVSLKTLGDQPGRPTPRYLSSWQTLPDGAHITPEKFTPGARNPSYPVMVITNGSTIYSVLGFQYTNNIPFPSDQVVAYSPYNTFGNSSIPYVTLPYIAFNYLGQLVDGANSPTGVDEIIPLTKGSVMFSKNRDKTAGTNAPTVLEAPAGNTTNSFDIVRVDWLTGRARAERLEVQP
jgi:prepilin-type N-terminal cleavage/methylation domain-containing protein